MKIDFINHACFSIEEDNEMLMFDPWFFKFPWGADTINIASCFEVYNKNLWRQNLIFKDEIYER